MRRRQQDPGFSASAKTRLPLVGIALVLLGAAGTKLLQHALTAPTSKAADAQPGAPAAALGSQPERSAPSETFTAPGIIVARRGIVLSTDVPGVVRRVHFDSGALVRRGQVLLELEDAVERAQLTAARARKALARKGLARARRLFASGTITEAQLDAAVLQLQTSRAEVQGLEAQLGRKVLRAPFDGRLGMRDVDVGQFLAPGAPVTRIDTLGAMYVDFHVGRQHLLALKPGLSVQLKLAGEDAVEASGTLETVDPAVHHAEQTLKVRARVDGAADRLRPGMAAEVSLRLARSRRELASDADRQTRTR